MTDQTTEWDYLSDELQAEIISMRLKIEKLEAKNAKWQDVIDTSVAVYARLMTDYMALKTELAILREELEVRKRHITDLNKIVDILGPLVARACTKLTPASIGSEYYADFEFARDLRAALNNVTNVQNAVYKEE